MRFNSKILLFGEYSLLHNSMGLAIPYSKYSGNLNMPNNDNILSRSQIESNASIKKLAISMVHSELIVSKYKFNQFLEDALLGLNFDSNIPKNYGIGSSGALVAAIYHQYFKSSEIDLTNAAALKNLKSELLQIEAYFHGTSSGIDPLVSYLNTPILINAPANHFTFVMPGNLCFFLIDTESTSKTKNFIEIFNSKLQKNPVLLKNFIHLNNKCIAAFFEKSADIFQIIKNLCDFEQEFLPEMFLISNELQTILNSNKDNFIVKLCGSGGGGYLLGITEKNNFQTISNELSHNKIIIELIAAKNQQLINC